MEGAGVAHVDGIDLVPGPGGVLVPDPGLEAVPVPSLQIIRNELDLVLTPKNVPGKRASLVAVAVQSLQNVPVPGLGLDPVLVAGHRNGKETLQMLMTSPKRMALLMTMTVVPIPDLQLHKKARRLKTVTCVLIVPPP